MELQNSFLESLTSAAWTNPKQAIWSRRYLAAVFMAAYVPLRATISGSVPVQDFAQVARRKLLKMVFCNGHNSIM
jgi:hypothetical protein